LLATLHGCGNKKTRPAWLSGTGLYECG
jgi:hypothetical protein